MRTLLLGIGLFAVSRLLSRRQAGGFGRFTSLTSLAAMVAGAAATHMMNRTPAHAGPAGNHRNQSFWRLFSPQPKQGDAT